MSLSTPSVWSRRSRVSITASEVTVGLLMADGIGPVCHATRYSRRPALAYLNRLGFTLTWFRMTDESVSSSDMKTRL